MQSSYELVKRAIEFSSPERVPYNFDENRSSYIGTRYGDDFIWVFVDIDPEFAPSQPGENEFGVVYESVDSSFGQAVKHPLEDWKDFDCYRLPDFTLPSRYKNIERSISEKSDKYVLGMLPHFLFMTMLDLLGFEKLMIDINDKCGNIYKLIDVLTESCLAVVDCMADRGVDGIIAIEDLGVQDRLMISPDMWGELFKPAYARIFHRAHQKGLHVFLHSCGYILELIEPLIEIGLDVINIDQQDNMGIRNISDRYGGRICFFCPVDIQTIMPMPNNFDAIEQRVKELIDALGRFKGGFIAKTYPQPESIAIPEANTAYMCEMFKCHGSYIIPDFPSKSLQKSKNLIV